MLYELESFLKELVYKGHHELLRAFMSNMFPLLPKENIESFMEWEYVKLIQGKDKATADILFESIGLTDSQAESYLKSYLAETEPNKRERYYYLSQASKSVKTNIGLLFATACMVGDLPLIEEIIHNCGLPKFDSNAVQYHFSSLMIDGEVIEGIRDEIRCKSASEIQKLIGYIHDSGLKVLLVPNQYGETPFFKLSRFESHNEILDIGYPPQKSVPTLVAGKVKNPEMALAMKDAAGNVHMKRPYSRIPCWVAKDIVDHLETKRVVKRNQSIKLKVNGTIEHEGKQYRNPFIIESWDSINPDIVNQFVKDYDHDIEATMSLDLDHEGPERRYDDAIRLDIFLDDDHKYGFNHPKDQILCLVDVDELLNYPIDKVDVNKLAECEEFVQNCLGLPSVYGRLYGQGIWDVQNPEYRPEVEPNYKIGLGSGYGSGQTFLLYMTRDKASSDLAISKLGERTFLKVIGRAHPAEADTYINLYKHYGYSNAHYSMHVNDTHLKAFEEIGFRFVDGSSAYVGEHTVHYAIENDAAFCHRLAKMGLWPGSSSAKPESFNEALKALVRKPSAQIQGWLLAQDIEEVAKECKTRSQWEALVRLYPAHEKAKIVAMMPKDLKRYQLESDLGL